jgi:hypothetical protein
VEWKSFNSAQDDKVDLTEALEMTVWEELRLTPATIRLALFAKNLASFAVNTNKKAAKSLLRLL